MKTLDRLKFIILFLLFISQTYAQYSNPNSYKKPFVTFDLNFGYAAPSFDLAGTNIKDFYNLSNYATQNGFNANFTTKFTIANLQPDWQVRTYLTISYAQFMGSEDRASNIGGFIKTGPRYFYRSFTRHAQYSKYIFQMARNVMGNSDPILPARVTVYTLGSSEGAGWPAV